MILFLKELLTTKKKWLFFTEFRYNKRRINKWSEFIKHRHKKVSPVRYGESTSNTTSVGAAASTTGSVIIGLTCSLELVVPGVRVVSIEETSVWGARGIVIGGTKFPFASRAGGTVGSFRDFGFFDSTWAGPRVTLFRFGWYSAIASGMPRNVGNASFGLFFVVRGSTGALLSNTFVLFWISWISSSILWFDSTNVDKSVGNDFDSGRSGVNNTGYMLQDVADKAIGGIRRLIQTKFEI